MSVCHPWIGGMPASHLILQPDKQEEGKEKDVAVHSIKKPPLYNPLTVFCGVVLA